MQNSLESFGQKFFFGAIGVAAVVACIAAVIAGLGIITGLVTGVLVAIVIFFGAIKELAASIVVGSILTSFTTDIRSFAEIWWTGPRAEKFFGLVESTGYFKIIILIFFVAYTTSFLTSRIKLLTVRSEVSVKNEKTKDDE